MASQQFLEALEKALEIVTEQHEGMPCELDDNCGGWGICPLCTIDYARRAIWGCRDAMKSVIAGEEAKKRPLPKGVSVGTFDPNGWDLTYGTSDRKAQERIDRAISERASYGGAY